MNLQNTIFKTDPFAFVQQCPINLLSIKAADNPADNVMAMQVVANVGRNKRGRFDLNTAPLGGFQNVFLRPFGGAGPHVDPLIEAHWCDYVSQGDQGNGLARVPYVDLRKQRPQHDYMFTGAMNGCSLVVTQNRPGWIRVYHDSAHHANTFQTENVLVRLDYCPNYFNSPHFYYPNAADGGQSANFLYYKRNAPGGACWHVVCQPLLSAGAPVNGVPPVRLNPALPSFEFPVP